VGWEEAELVAKITERSDLRTTKMYLRLGALKDSQGLARQMAIASEQEVALDELIFTRWKRCGSDME
jgi:hypothetical protein